ncbi:hypothetical protein EHS25_006074 [Saitozyma podzolica]|uniref:BAR domain-containing protein n=1 Tax=Saitozyma podzolica TaxID=1890683 RepID=A0A427XTS9_9TREE|nr:hypothetical protein EHS25_006074 [Saitozyma podzolica]
MSSKPWTRYKQRVFDDLSKQTEASDELVTALQALEAPTTSSNPSDEIFNRRMEVQLAGTRCTVRARAFLATLLPKLGGPLRDFATLPKRQSEGTDTTPGQVSEVDILSATQRYHTAVAVLQNHCNEFTAAESSAFVEQQVSELTEWYESYTNLDSTLKEFSKALKAEDTSGSGNDELIPRDPE